MQRRTMMGMVSSLKKSSSKCYRGKIANNDNDNILKLRQRVRQG